MPDKNLILQKVVAVFLKADNGSFLMQLRDDKPYIVYPNHWGLFGGDIEIGESVCEAASRELAEEINIQADPGKISEFRRYSQPGLWVYTCRFDLKVNQSKLSLQEGADLGFFSLKEILTGRLFSQKFNNFFPVADPLIGYFRDVSNIDEQTTFLKHTS